MFLEQRGNVSPIYDDGSSEILVTYFEQLLLNCEQPTERFEKISFE